jgi:hypothetical protein
VLQLHLHQIWHHWALLTDSILSSNFFVKKLKFFYLKFDFLRFSNGIDKSVDRSRHCKAAKNHKPLSASMKHREPKNVKKKRGTEAATTESISDTYNCLALDMKSRSANEMSQTKRPSFLQRIRLRLSSKSGTVQQEKLNQMDQHVFNELSFPLQRLAGEELSREKRPVIQQNGQKHLLLKKQKYEIMQAESKPEALQYQEADAISQVIYLESEHFFN